SQRTTVPPGSPCSGPAAPCARVRSDRGVEAGEAAEHLGVGAVGARARANSSKSREPEAGSRARSISS
ncbi:hypothetical protein RZS08_02415, partial [Arthrospira platensis SPKY1]|nr:hypothetical protein [Arthrospira platensis SPKY1]